MLEVFRGKETWYEGGKTSWRRCPLIRILKGKLELPGEDVGRVFQEEGPCEAWCVREQQVLWGECSVKTAQCEDSRGWGRRCRQDPGL